MADLHLFRYTESPVALSFVNVGFLLETLWSPTKYLTLQPAFILASMALAVLIRSSETERGAAGRERAAFLRHSAQDTLERTWREGVWLDASLAEAALVRIMSSPKHPLLTKSPDHRPVRSVCAPRVPPRPSRARIRVPRRGDQRARADDHRRGEPGRVPLRAGRLPRRRRTARRAVRVLPARYAPAGPRPRVVEFAAVGPELGRARDPRRGVPARVVGRADPCDELPHGVHRAHTP